MSAIAPVLIAGRWRPAAAAATFRAFDPTAGRACAEEWPVSRWADVDEALAAAVASAAELATLPAAQLGEFLDRFAARLKARGEALVAAAHAETGLAVKPRLADVELPRTLDQLRQAAASAREQTWRMAMLDTAKNIRAACFGIGPVVVFPPANFPLAYGCVTGGDMAAAIAAGNPVIAKAHPGHPSISRLAAEEALEAVRETGLPPATVQLIHGLEDADGERLVADPRVGATGFTGSEAAGRKLFAAATAAGNVIWVEMGSINPVVLLPAALAERGGEIAGELALSVTGSAGQFCTKPGLVFFVGDAAGAEFVLAVTKTFASIGPQVLLSEAGCRRLGVGIEGLVRAGATLLAGQAAAAGPARHVPTLLEVAGSDLVARPESFVVEAFGNATLLVRCGSLAELTQAVRCAHGSLSASLYCGQDGRDEAAFAAIAPLLVARAGRVIENRMPTGLAVTPPMQHGGPWPSAAPPFFSAVGLPWSILRFARRICFDGWTERRLPEIVRDAAPAGNPWRYVDCCWVRR
ncbi:MAG: aldehyde dehydrogenase family protein [Planctomycetes bacterium]|nr:aldehyde dehydrogenase family protein [Planctomycetota bacterium]